MPSLLDTAAISSRGGDEAKEILGNYIQTSPSMIFNHTLDAAPEMKPRANVPQDPAGPTPTGPMGSGGNMPAGMTPPPSTPAPSSSGIDPVVSEYEIFKNENNALAFFFFRHPSSEMNKPEGPFWFTVTGDKISAGTETHHTIFEDVKPDVLEIAKQRGVIMLVEFEEQQPVRCTPCYLTDRF